MSSLKKYVFVTISIILFLSSYNSFSQIPMDGLVGYYKLDGDAVDSSPVGNDGVMVDQVSPIANRFDEPDKACLFFGGYIDAGNPVELQITDSISIAAWIKVDTIDGWSGLVTKWRGGGIGGIFLGANPNLSTIRWNINMPDPVESNTIVAGEWIYIVTTFDGDTAKVYQDGILVNMINHSSPIPDNDANLIIGSQSNVLTANFDGAIDDVLIYNRALSQDEIDVIYNQVISSTQENIYNESVVLSPNPTDGILKVSNMNNHEILSYTFCNSAGQQLQTGDFKDELNINNQPSGIYYLILKFKDGTVTKKVIKP